MRRAKLVAAVEDALATSAPSAELRSALQGWLDNKDNVDACETSYSKLLGIF